MVHDRNAHEVGPACASRRVSHASSDWGSESGTPCVPAEWSPQSRRRVLTRRLAQAGDLMGIAVVDHVVLGDGCWHSVRESAPAVLGS